MTSAIVAGGGLAKAWLVTLGMMAVQGTVLALVAIALVRGAGRLRPAWRAAIWLVVMLKFVLPWGPGLPWSLSDLVAALTASEPSAPVVVGPPALQPLPAAPHVGAAIAWLVLATIWLAIAITMIVRAVLAARRTYAAARAAVVREGVRAEHAVARLASLAQRIGVRTPMLAIGDGPHVVGLVRPIVVVPEALLAEPALLEAALLHELAHVRRRDALGRAVQVLANALLFFWPVVRVVGRRLDLARESACDAWALEAGELARPAYARLLVRMAELHHQRRATLALAAPRALDARIAAVLGPPTRARIGVAQRVLLGAWIVIGLGGARTAHARGEQPTCHYTPQLAQALFLSYPEADLDGDGQLSRDEACELQAELRRHADELASRLDPESEAVLEDLLSEPLCCNCDRAEANSSADVARAASCQKDEGVDR